MIQAFFLFLLLIYYWYFYGFSFQSVEKPATGSPFIAPSYQFEFKSKQPNHFQFTVNGSLAWEHTLSTSNFTFHKDQIVAIDPCYNMQNNTLIPATGKFLYDYMKSNPDTKNLLHFRTSEYTLQKGNVFYFRCQNNHIEKLEMCPSGTIFLNNRCQNVSSCSGKVDGTILPHPMYASKYIVCRGGTEMESQCAENEIFYHSRCESAAEFTHYCKNASNTPFLYSDNTRAECQEGKLVFIRCKPGTQFISNINQCEHNDCVGKPNGTQLPLPERHIGPFHFIPGYMVCSNNKIENVVECSHDWDDSLTKGDNLTFLPMVYHSGKCSIPSFCENVFSNDEKVVVPVHEFTKYVKNWNLSKFLDRNVGYKCINGIRKREPLDEGQLISKRFKNESGCGPYMPEYLPIYEKPSSFYDCHLKATINCPPSQYFDGDRCQPTPRNVFKFKGIPLFQFDSLNFESWIKPWDYSGKQPLTCRPPESTYVKLYSICSHPDCTNYAFLSQIPDLSILLPEKEQAKCKFYEGIQTLKKEPVHFEYDFWTQKALTGKRTKPPCEPGQNLETGNFIWDSTVFATCNFNQPFVFCPSTHGRQIIPITNDYYACKPPSATTYEFREADWTQFEQNEILQVLPILSVNTAPPPSIRINKGSPKEYIPVDGLDVPEGQKINLFPFQPVKLRPRYRVTHPPNVVFEYNKNGQMRPLVWTPDGGFLTKRKTFTAKPLKFWRYRAKHFMKTLTTSHNV